MAQRLRSAFVISVAILALAPITLSAQGGCMLGSVNLNVVAAPQPTITGNNQFCQGGSTTLTVPQNFDSYSWSTNDNGPSTTVNAPGTYTVTVTNSAGCTGTATQTVTQSPAPSPTITAAPYQCNGQFTLDAGPGYTSYNWSTSGTNQTTTAPTAGTYTVTVTNSVGCTGTDEFDVTIPPPPVVTISGDNQICTNGSGTLQATPGFSTYTWNTGGNGSSITVTTAGTYTVTATDAFGCTDNDNFTVTTLPPPTPAITGPAAICANSSGTLTVTQSFPNYNWSTGGSTQSIDVTTAGNYIVTVTDANGCTGTASFNLTVNPVPTPTITASPYACNGQFTLNGGSGFSAYNWSTGQTINPITVNANGTYGLTVTDANGCTGTDVFDVTIPPPPVVTISGDNQICANGSGTLEATPGFSTYVWNTGGNGSSITVTIAGTYTVTATDAFGCTDSDNFTVSTLPPPTPAITGPAAICANSSGTLTVTQNFPNYNWSTGSNTQSIDVTTAGTYIVTVTDANGCTGTASFNLTVNPAPTPTITASPYACNGQFTLNGGGGFSAYNWSTGQTINPITVNANGTYGLTVTDANGCTGTDAFFVTIPPPPAVGISGNAQFCQGGNSVLEATPGLNAYVWSNSQTGPTITVVTAGTYAVTASDGFGCTATDAFSVNILPAPVPTITGPTSFCANEFATLLVPGTFSTYVWSNGFAGPSITVNTAGTYIVTVTDAAGCTGTASHALTVLAAPQPDITIQPYNCDGQLTLVANSGYPTYAWSTGQSGNPITVTADGNYEVTVTAVNGCTGQIATAADIPDAPIVGISGDAQICQGASTLLEATPGLNTYVWSTGQTGASISVNAAGNYEVTATDGFGCTATDVFPVQVVPNPVPTIAGPTSICAGGSATFTVPGSFSTYAWNTGGNTSSITVSNAGTYTVMVTDANGCTGAAGQTLSISTNLEPQIAEQPYLCDGQIGLDAGAGFSTYAWSSGQNTPTITVNTSGPYTVTVTDNTGCSGTDVVTVNIPDAPVVGITGPSAICQNTSGVLDASPGFGTYVWSNGLVGPSISVSQGGPYTVTATDGFGCTAEADFILIVNPAPTTAINGPTLLCFNSSDTLTAAGNFNSYTWSTTATTPSISVNATGSYTVTVANSFGCTGTAVQTVAVQPELVPVVSVLPYACNGQITLDAGAGFVTYLWSSGQTTASISVGTSGDYTVTVTDATGCTGTAIASATIPAPPVVAVSGNTVFCENASTALAATPGFAAYLWSGGQTTPDITVSATGTYGVTATDAIGCTATAALAVAAQPLPVPQIAGPTAICTNSTGTLSVTGTFTAYTWSTTETTPSILVNTAGTYTVMVTDALGCTGIAAQTVAVVSQLQPQITAQPYACSGQIALDASAGFATYLWSSGQNTASISVGTSGDYTVTVTDASGCTGTAIASATVPVPPVVAVSGNTVFCENTSTALAATPGFVAYLWSGGQTTPGITVSATGTYGVTATDALGCTATAALAVAAQPLPVPQIAGPMAICTNSSGTLSVTGNFSTYLWSTTETTPSISVNTAGTYTVMVTDALGCTGIAAQTVAVVSQLQPQITAKPYACNGQIALDASAGFTTYQWSSGQNTASISVGTSGNYTVTVADATGCTGTAVASATVPAPPVVAVSGNNVFCENASTALTATPGFSAYLWSDGQTTPGITVSATGTYGVTATDALGCTATAAMAVAAQPLPVPQITGPSVLCTNSSGTLTVTGTFTAYTWSTTETTPSILVNTAGTYAVTVTDALGCTGISAQSVTVASQLQPQITAKPYACNGQITLDASAGFANYLWNSGQNTPSISVSLSGNYTVTVTDAIGCTGTAIASATVPAPPVVAVSGNLVFCANTSTPLAATPGFSAYLWSTGAVTPGISVTTTGTYTVTATDALGCTATASAATTAQPLPVPAIAGTAALCPGKTGTLSVSGAFSAYAWNTGQGTPTITVGSPGNYLVTVTDLNGCTSTASASVAAATADTTYAQLSTCIPANVGTTVQVFPGSGGCDSVVITQTLLLNLPVSGTTAVLSNFNGFSVACTGGTNGQAIATPLMGVAPFSFSWSNGSTEQVAQNLGAGTYSVTFTDANGCSGTATVTLNAPAPVQPVILATDPTCQNAGIIEVTQVTGGVGPYTVRLVQEIGTTNGTQPLNFSTLDAGTFEIEVTDANGCKALETVVLLPADIVEEFVSDTFEVFKGDTVVLNAGAGITIQPLFITWTPATDLSCDDCLNPSIVPVRTTLIELDVAGFGGCKATGLFLIIVKATGTYYAPNVIKPGSPNNYGFTIYGDKDLVNIRQLQVYDRWGNHMAVFNNIVPNDPARGWDGRFKGQDMNPAVFVWWAELEFSDGSTQIVKGDVTVVR